MKRRCAKYVVMMGKLGNVTEPWIMDMWNIVMKSMFATTFMKVHTTTFLKILMSNMLIDKSNVSELDGYDNEAKYFRFCGIDLDIGTDNCYSQNTEEGHIFVCTCKDSERPCNRDADCLFTCN